MDFIRKPLINVDNAPIKLTMKMIDGSILEFSSINERHRYFDELRQENFSKAKAEIDKIGLAAWLKKKLHTNS